MYELMNAENPDLMTEELKQEYKITQTVKAFYEKIQFPGHRPMEQDSLIFLRKFSTLIDEHKSENNPIHVLDAGCGTGNTSIGLAAQFKDVQFLGIDLSASSINIAKKDAREKNLDNVKFLEWNLLDLIDDRGKFDIILCFGVLHHTAHMQKVLNNLASVLSPVGSMFLWVYGKYGRYFHSLNVELLSMLLSARPDEDSDIDLARDFIANTNGSIVIKDLLGDRSEDEMLIPFYADPTWIADQFLNPNEFMVDMKDLFNLATNAGLTINNWLGVSKDISKYIKSEKLQKFFADLTSEKQIIALDLILKTDKYFLILNRE